MTSRDFGDLTQGAPFAADQWYGNHCCGAVAMQCMGSLNLPHSRFFIPPTYSASSPTGRPVPRGRAGPGGWAPVPATPSAGVGGGGGGVRPLSARSTGSSAHSDKGPRVPTRPLATDSRERQDDPTSPY